MKNGNVWSISSFFWTQNGMKLTRKSRKTTNNDTTDSRELLSFASLNEPRSCSSVSVAIEEDYIILE